MLGCCLKDPTHAAFKEKMREFMANFDKNSDGRIEMTEVGKKKEKKNPFAAEASLPVLRIDH